MIRRLLILFAIALGIGVTAHAQDIPEPMSPRRIVNDFTGLFSKQEQATLEQKLVDFNKNSSTQIAVITVHTLDGHDINDYAARLGEKWGIGQKGKDNGIVILVKPKNGREKGEVAISVGYGLEGVVPDITASRIIRNEIIPAFQKGQYHSGINKATSILIDLSKGEYTADEYKKKSEGGSLNIVLGIFVFFMIISLIFRRKGGSGYSPGHTSAGGGGFFMFPMGGGSSGGFGGFSSGGGSFGGFGGGSFGGGGSSGSW